MKDKRTYAGRYQGHEIRFTGKVLAVMAGSMETDCMSDMRQDLLAA
jgi:hypothetical protein